ncbi:hypothetical protein SAMN05421553_0461 [Pseudomonas anguilliseptica]|uniref:Uncharacterized protein n=1 Tax=Pseudomonas anguilliseptica TaxID=53406 RepID=A0A1H4QFP1_PSEAG|nr:hypothetical protein SAMN05421553_0461 [Pseudomonas anguilliseptica]
MPMSSDLLRRDLLERSFPYSLQSQRDADEL